MADASMAGLQGDAPLIEAWRPLAEKALKGAPFDTLRTVTADGLTLEPLYGAAPPLYAGRPSAGAWQVVCSVDGDTGAAEKARADLENGATALSLVFAGAAAAAGRGVTADTVDALDAALAGVHLDLVPLHIEAGATARPALALLAALFDRRGAGPAALHAGLDPVGSFATGGAVADWASRGQTLADTVRGFQALGIAGTALRADGRMVFEAGGTAVDELGFALASLAVAVRVLAEAGLPPSETLPLASMALAADVDQPTTIAKMRAARRTFALFAKACGVETPLHLHATTGSRMLSYSDPQTNILRLTVAAFAAGVGGADAVTVLPFDAAASPFARRVSRNIQTLLLDEAHLGAFADPAAGSGAFEALTDQLAEEAWAAFQAHERAGLLREIESGALAARMAAAAEARRAALEAGERTMIGVTRHPPPTPSEARPAPMQPPAAATSGTGSTFANLVAAAAGGATLADLAVNRDGARPITAPPLVPRRDAAPFEA